MRTERGEIVPWPYEAPVPRRRLVQPRHPQWHLRPRTLEPEGAYYHVAYTLSAGAALALQGEQRAWSVATEYLQHHEATDYRPIAANAIARATKRLVDNVRPIITGRHRRVATGSL
jgi:hypothetical protein